MACWIRHVNVASTKRTKFRLSSIVFHSNFEKCETRREAKCAKK